MFLHILDLLHISCFLGNATATGTNQLTVDATYHTFRGGGRVGSHMLGYSPLPWSGSMYSGIADDHHIDHSSRLVKHDIRSSRCEQSQHDKHHSYATSRHSVRGQTEKEAGDGPAEGREPNRVPRAPPTSIRSICPAVAPRLHCSDPEMRSTSTTTTTTSLSTMSLMMRESCRS